MQCGKRGERRGAGRFVHLKLAQAGDEKEQTDGNYRRLNHPVSVPVKKGLRQIRVGMKWKRMLEFM